MREILLSKESLLVIVIAVWVKRDHYRRNAATAHKRRISKYISICQKKSKWCRFRKKGFFCGWTKEAICSSLCWWKSRDCYPPVAVSRIKKEGACRCGYFITFLNGHPKIEVQHLVLCRHTQHRTQMRCQLLFGSLVCPPKQPPHGIFTRGLTTDHSIKPL